MSPSVQPAPQWLVPFITIAANGGSELFAMLVVDAFRPHAQ
jgi:hypothetical protein